MAGPGAAEPDQIPLAHEAWQLAALQNPILDPGFSLLAEGVPFWDGVTAADVDADGRLVISKRAAQTHGLVVGKDQGVPLVVSPFVGFENLTFHVTAGSLDVELIFAEKSTGQTVTVAWSGIGPGSQVLDLATATITEPLPHPDPAEVVAQSLWLGIAFSSAGATIDDVVLHGVAYGDPLVSLDLDEPIPPGKEFEAVQDDPVKPFHDGFGVLIDIREITTSVGDVPEYFATVSFVRFTPSGAVPYDLSTDVAITLDAVPFGGGDRVRLGSWSPADGTVSVVHGGILFKGAHLGTFSLPADPGSPQSLRIEASLELDPASIVDTDAYPNGRVVGVYNPLKLLRPDAPAVDGLDVVPQPFLVRTAAATPTGDADGDGVDDLVEPHLCGHEALRDTWNNLTGGAVGTCVSSENFTKSNTVTKVEKTVSPVVCHGTADPVESVTDSADDADCDGKSNGEEVAEVTSDPVGHLGAPGCDNPLLYENETTDCSKIVDPDDLFGDEGPYPCILGQSDPNVLVAQVRDNLDCDGKSNQEEIGAIIADPDGFVADPSTNNPLRPE